jgi:aminocyclitol acetyltransferase
MDIVDRMTQKYARGRATVFWGAGADGKRLLETRGQENRPAFITDVQLSNISGADGVEILPDSALDIEKHYVVIATGKYRAEVESTLRGRGFAADADYCFFADTTLAERELIDVEINGAVLGRGSYCPDVFFRDGIVIGRYTSISGRAFLHGDHPLGMTALGHVYQAFSESNRREWRARHDVDKRRLTIGSDVWIGANAFINISRVNEIGDGAVIGTGAIVLEDVPPYAVVVGAPAKIKRYRFTPEQIEVLRRVRWWDWSAEELDANAKLLMCPELFFARFS